MLIEVFYMAKNRDILYAGMKYMGLERIKNKIIRLTIPAIVVIVDRRVIRSRMINLNE